MSPRALMIDVAAVLALGCLGVTVAWLMRRTTNLAARNLYPPALLSLATLIASAAAHTWIVVLIVAPVCALTGSAAVYAHRLRLSDLGAGEDCAPTSWRAAGSGSPHRRALRGSACS
jgi:hypothetical protein